MQKYLVYLPQHAGRRRICFSPTLAALVVALREFDRGIESHVWLSGMQKRASWTNEVPSTKLLSQKLSMFIKPPSTSGNLIVHVPQPTWDAIMIPWEDSFFWDSSTSVRDLFKECSLQFGQPITPSTISPSTISASPTWKSHHRKIYN